MLVIRARQMDALAEARHARFVERAVPLMRQAWPRQTASHTDEALAQLVRDAIAAGARFGVTEGRHVLALADVYLFCGRDFEQRPDCARIRAALARTGRPVAERFRLVDTLLVPHIATADHAVV